MQRLSTVLWILLITSRVHAQPNDHQARQAPPAQQEPRPIQQPVFPQEPSREAPQIGLVETNAVPNPVTSQLPDAPVSQTRKLASIGFLASGGAALGVGIIVGMGARSTYGEVKTLCGADLVCDTPSTFERGQHLVRIARLQAGISTVTIAAGGAAVLSGLVVWLTAPTERRTETTRVVPIVSAKDVALAVTGRF
jgi:hypothetical protein